MNGKRLHIEALTRYSEEEHDENQPIKGYF